MMQRVKEGAFFVTAFLLFAWGLSFLAPRPATAPQPAAIDLSWLASIFSDIATAAAYTLGLLLFGLLLYVFVVPYINKVRDREWQRRQDRTTEQHQVAAERPIIYNGPSNALALKSERAKRENLQLLLDSISGGLSQLCYQVTGQQEPDAVRAIKVLEDSWREMRETMRELDGQLSEVSQERATASPRGASWQDVLALMEWARERDRIGVRASRDMLRGRGVPIPEQEFGAFSAYVQGLAPLPRPQVSQEQEKQATDSGRTSSLRRTDRATGRSQPRTRKGKR